MTAYHDPWGLAGPSGPAGPGPTGPAGPRPGGPPAPPVPADTVLAEADAILAADLPRLGEVVRDAERFLAQALAVLRREVDPESLPDLFVAERLLSKAAFHAEAALADLAALGMFTLPPAGSAVKIPARQDPVEARGAYGIATTGEPVRVGAAPVVSDDGGRPGGPPSPGAGDTDGARSGVGAAEFAASINHALARRGR